MRVLLRVFSVACAIGLVVAWVATPASAKPPKPQTVFNIYHVDGPNNWEYRWACGETAPFACYTYGGHVVFQIVVTNRPSPATPITVNYAIDDITAINGVNYSGPTTGSLVIDSYPPGHNDVQLAIPIIDSGSVGAANKTLSVRLTSTSVPGANISDTEIGFIKSEGEIPRDCTPSRADGESFSTTCTGRAPTSQWRVSVSCLDEWPHFPTVYGALITGNGTSSATCTGTGFSFAWWDFHLIS